MRCSTSSSVGIIISNHKFVFGLGSSFVGTKDLSCLLKDVVQGDSIFNVELSPGSGGKVARAAGTKVVFRGFSFSVSGQDNSFVVVK